MLTVDDLMHSFLNNIIFYIGSRSSFIVQVEDILLFGSLLANISWNERQGLFLMHIFEELVAD